MRFLETLLLVCVAVYVAQLIIAALILATLILFLYALVKRPREALALGFGVLVVALLTKLIGLALVAVIGAGFLCWALAGWIKTRRYRGTNRPVALLPKF